MRFANEDERQRVLDACRVWPLELITLATELALAGHRILPPNANRMAAIGGQWRQNGGTLNLFPANRLSALNHPGAAMPPGVSRGGGSERCGGTFKKRGKSGWSW